MVEKYTDRLSETSDYNALLDRYRAVETLDADNVTQAEKREALQTPEQLYGSGFTMAAHHIGRAWRDGLGILPDDEGAEFWFQQAAEAGNQNAQYHPGKLYLQGEIVPRDIPAAAKYLPAAAEQGTQYAQYALGRLCLSGNRIPQNKEQATYWLTQSAAQGHRYAQYLLGRLDENLSPNGTAVGHPAPPPHESSVPRNSATVKSSGIPCRQQTHAANPGKENRRRA